MKLLFTNDWLREKIPSDPDHEPLAGGFPESEVEDGGRTAVMRERNVVQLRISLGVLVRKLRIREGLTIAELSEKADVAEDELLQVEHDPHYTARPRLIFQLSEYFKVSLVTLAQISGATHVVQRALYNEAVKFAAHSDDVSVLSGDELRLLDAFVALLNERTKV